MRRYGIDECLDASDAQRVVSFGFMSTWSFQLHISDISTIGTSILRLSCLIGQEMVDGRDGLVIIAPMQISTYAVRGRLLHAWRSRF